MPYPLNHGRETRARIVTSARKLFNRLGFDGVTIGDIMKDAGLTHGGFYRHFESKSDLYAEVLDCFFTNPEWSCGWKGMEEFDEAAELAPQIIRAYLSNAHFDDIENACPMVALDATFGENTVLGEASGRLDAGGRVRFSKESGENGPQAHTIRVI